MGELEYFGNDLSSFKREYEIKTKNVLSFSERAIIAYNLARVRFDFLGSGATRYVFDTDRDYVLKTPMLTNMDSEAQTKAFIRYNFDDVNNKMLTKFKDIFPQSGPRSKDYVWITQEKVNIINWGNFDDIMPKLFPFFSRVIMSRFSPNYIKDFFDSMCSNSLILLKENSFNFDNLVRKLNNDTIVDINIEHCRNFPHESRAFREQKLKFLLDLTNAFFAERSLFAIPFACFEYSLVIVDIRPENYGYVEREGKKQFVILDVSRLKFEKFYNKIRARDTSNYYEEDETFRSPTHVEKIKITGDKVRLFKNHALT